ncbi:hypothetical protein B0H14DRAFT_2640181 [Mycena olivaceomarginata]|nr:hypothetical protein B0H14DRAFT_2640181 [Mycena olivaceomarginata]
MRLWAAFWPLLVALSILLATIVVSEGFVKPASMPVSLHTEAPVDSLEPRRCGIFRMCLGWQHGPGVEERRSIQRDADRERQLALQETPSRRRRRIPEARDENRAPSPTPVARRPVPQALVHLQRCCGRPRYLQIDMP